MTIFTNFNIFIVSFLICIFSVCQVQAGEPIFGNCLDKQFSELLRIIMLRDTSMSPPPIDEAETNRTIENVMRLIKLYLSEDVNFSPPNIFPGGRRFIFSPRRKRYPDYQPSDSYRASRAAEFYGRIGLGGVDFGAKLGEFYRNEKFRKKEKSRQV